MLTNKKRPFALPTLLAWVQALRMPFYMASIFPVTIAGVLSFKYTQLFSPLVFFILLAGTLLLHAATNLINDVFDFNSGVDKEDGIGGSGVIRQGKLSLASLRGGAIFCYVGSFLAFFALALWLNRLWILPVWGFGFFSSYFYVGPPLRYGYRALGELFVFLNYGIVMLLGSFAVLTGAFDGRVLALSVVFGLMSAGLIFYQNIPEIETDKEVGKITLAIVLGKRRAVCAVVLLWPLLSACIISFCLMGLLSLWAVCSVLGLFFYMRLLPHLKQALKTDKWLWLDDFGHLVRKVFMCNMLGILLGVIF